MHKVITLILLVNSTDKWGLHVNTTTASTLHVASCRERNTKILAGKILCNSEAGRAQTVWGVGW